MRSKKINPSHFANNIWPQWKTKGKKMSKQILNYSKWVSFFQRRKLAILKSPFRTEQVSTLWIIAARFLTVKEGDYKYINRKRQNELFGVWVELEVAMWILQFQYRQSNRHRSRHRCMPVCVCAPAYFPSLLAEGTANKDTPVAMSTPRDKYWLLNIIFHKVKATDP